VTTERKRRIEKKPNKDEAIGATVDAPMDRFKSLAKRLLLVSRSELDKERLNKSKKVCY
jgi:hypothetical protein